MNVNDALAASGVEDAERQEKRSRILERKKESKKRLFV